MKLHPTPAACNLAPEAGRSASEDGIRALVEQQVAAVRARDADAIMAGCAPDMLSFDVIPPLRNRGSAATRERLENWFAAYAGPVGCEVRDLQVEAGGDIGFCYGLQRFTGTMTSGAYVDMWVRMTMCFRKVDGKWLIVHEHMSDPFDPESGRALIDLEP